ncbi:hypothetical protein [Runella sp.]|uniref:hypothetical protein n=1 Tax=Runella sp. TaxID=1960881 RepID=UPI003D134308
MEKKNKTLKVQNKDVYILLFFLPSISCLYFWLRIVTGINVQIGSYFNFFLTLYLFFLIYKQNLELILYIVLSICIIASSYNIILGTKINESFSYLFTLANIIFAFFIFPEFDFSEIKIAKLKNGFIWFSILFVIVYEFSSVYALSRNNSSEYYQVERIYKEGFVISHLACYYLGVMGYFLYLMRQRILAIALFGYVITLGARIGLIYLAIAVALLILRNFPVLWKSIFRWRYIILLIIAIGLTIATTIALQKIGPEGLMVFTSGRSIFWMNAISKIKTDGYSLINFFGRGPKASFTFNEATFGLKIWMHNDYLDLLFNIGVWGLCLYLYSLVYFFNRVKALYLFLVFIFASLFNGFLYYDAIFVILLNTVFVRLKIA